MSGRRLSWAPLFSKSRACRCGMEGEGTMDHAGRWAGTAVCKEVWARVILYMLFILSA